MVLYKCDYRSTAVFDSTRPCLVDIGDLSNHGDPNAVESQEIVVIEFPHGMRGWCHHDQFDAIGNGLRLEVRNCSLQYFKSPREDHHHRKIGWGGSIASLRLLFIKFG